jgi:hypothetical protein
MASGDSTLHIPAASLDLQPCEARSSDVTILLQYQIGNSARARAPHQFIRCRLDGCVHQDGIMFWRERTCAASEKSRRRSFWILNLSRPYNIH